MSPSRLTLSAIAAAILLFVAYANHFDNGFHFDDVHAIVDNPAVRSVANIPRYFVAATTFSVLPSNRTYRPVLQTTFAIDYWIGGGYSLRVFQVSTFAWFLVQLLLMYWLFVQILSRAVEPASDAVALLATSLFALHPAGAETVNYIVQRGEILSTAGVVGALALYAWRPSWRRYGIYLVPAAVGALAKPAALVFPVLLFAYVWLLEPPETGRRLAHSLRTAAPATGAAVVTGLWIWSRTLPEFTTGGEHAGQYWLTQGWVTLRYVVNAVLPLWLSADHDWWVAPGGFDPRVVAGLLFVLAILALAIRTARSHRAISFGLWWFLIALAPTALTPLAEFASDHRTFFPFTGLALSAGAGAMLLWRRLTGAARRPAIGVAAVALVLLAGAAGVRARNEVWRTDESLWHDVTVKSPRNARGLMNYGLALMARGDFDGALTHFDRAREIAPTYLLVHINLGIAHGALGHTEDAERAFTRAIALDARDWRGHLYFGRWLAQAKRFEQAVAELTRARTANPLDPEAERLLRDTLDAWAADALDESLGDFRGGRFRECVTAATRGLAAGRRQAELHNNLAACHNSLGEWDAGIASAKEALRLDPHFQIAANNLAYALEHKRQQ